MKYMFRDSLIHNNELIFYIFVILMLSIIIYAAYFTYKEIKENENK